MEEHKSQAPPILSHRDRKKGPRQREASRRFNAYGEALAKKPRPSEVILKALYDAAVAGLDDFIINEAPLDPARMSWRIPTMRAAWAATQEKWDEAYQFDLTAFRAGQASGSVEDAAVSCGNLSGAALMLKRPKEALAWAELRQQLEPGRIVALTSLIVPYVQNGKADVANQLLSDLISRAKWDDPTDELAIRLTVDTDLHQLNIEAANRLREIVTKNDLPRDKVDQDSRQETKTW